MPSDSQPILEMKGVGEVLQVYEDRLTITPKGILGLMSKGLKGTKEIPYRSIIATQFKEAGSVFSGYIQFTIAGGNESRGGVFGAASDENTFMFAEKKNNEQAREIKDHIDTRVRAAHAPSSPMKTVALSEELLKLAELRAQGILSDEEFASAKARLLG